MARNRSWMLVTNRRIPKTLETIWIRYRFDAEVSARCLIDIYARVFAICDTRLYNGLSVIVHCCTRFSSIFKSWIHTMHVYYGDVTFCAMGSQVIGMWTVCSVVCFSTLQRKHQSSASLAFVDSPSYSSHWPLVGLNKVLDYKRKFQVIFKLILVIDGWSICCEIVLRWMSLDITDNTSTLVQVIAWCLQTISQYMANIDPDLCCHFATMN